MAQDLALTEATEPVHRERRVVRDLVIEIELAEPVVSKVQGHFLSTAGAHDEYHSSFLLSPPIVPVRNTTLASKFLSRSGSTQFFIHRIESAD
jgi:hypothetical protein